MSVTAIIPHYWDSRERDLQRIIESLREGSIQPHKIIVWNNTTRQLTLAHADVIDGNRNWGIAARFAAAYLARTKYVLFQDNDVALQWGCLENMLRAIEQEDGDVSIELQGRVLGEGTSRYTTSCYCTNVDRVVDIGLSRISLMKRSTAMKLAALVPPDVTDDDLWTSANVRVRIIPYGAGQGWLNFTESEGLCHDVAAHVGRRDRLVDQLWPK